VKWNAQAEREGRRFRVFCASLADVFDNAAPAAWRQDLMSLIVRTPHLDWLLLTKRVGNAKRMLSDASMHDGLLLTANDEYRPPANLWVGATIVNREEMLRDAAKLKATPAAVRFWSVEPLLEDLGVIPRELMPDWVIVGGESGPGARPMSPDWARRLREQCAVAGVPFLFKQWGEWFPMLGQAEGVPVRQKTTTPDGWVMGWAGKKAAGRLLDGRTHDQFPHDPIRTP
jgi:protein gp37